MHCCCKEHNNYGMIIVAGVLSEKVRSLPLTDERLQSEEEGEHREREERAIRTSGRWTNATIPFSFDKSTLSKFSEINYHLPTH